MFEVLVFLIPQIKAQHTVEKACHHILANLCVLLSRTCTRLFNIPMTRKSSRCNITQEQTLFLLSTAKKQKQNKLEPLVSTHRRTGRINSVLLLLGCLLRWLWLCLWSFLFGVWHFFFSFLLLGGGLEQTQKFGQRMA